MLKKFFMIEIMEWHSIYCKKVKKWKIVPKKIKKIKKMNQKWD